MSTPPEGQQAGGGYTLPSGPDGSGYGTQQSRGNPPMVLGIVGLACIILCWPAGILLGLVGQSEARRYGQSDTVPKIAWIASVISGVVSILISIVIQPA